MGVDVHLQTETGEILQSCFDPQSLVPAMLSQLDASRTTFLSSIDIYGDTTFNRAQAAELVDELSNIRPTLDAETKAHVDLIIKLVAIVQSEPNRYITFFGD
jgi:hypothetical protein